MPTERTRRDEVQTLQLTLRVCDLFFNHRAKPAQIAELLADEGENVSREQVYHYILRGRDLGWVRLVAPKRPDLATELIKEFRLRADSVVVVEPPPGKRPTDADATDYVTEAAAELAMKLLRHIQGQNPNKTSIGLGLGVGRFTLDFCRALSRLLDAEREFRLTLHAITATDPMKPEWGPLGFFNLFPERHIVERYGLFTEPALNGKEFKEMRERKRFGYDHAWTHRDDIDVIFTSLGDVGRGEEDGYYRIVTAAAGQSKDPTAFNPRKGKKKPQLVGNVQYRPYTASGPYLEDPDELRPVCLFELEDYQKMVHPPGNKFVILGVRQHPDRPSFSTALMPLLLNASLQVFSHLVIDVGTAEEVLKFRRG